jgi:hypothetical protein
VGQARYDSNNREVTSFGISEGSASIAASGYDVFRIRKTILPVERPLQWSKVGTSAKAYTGKFGPPTFDPTRKLDVLTNLLALAVEVIGHVESPKRPLPTVPPSVTTSSRSLRCTVGFRDGSFADSPAGCNSGSLVNSSLPPRRQKSSINSAGKHRSPVSASCRSRGMQHRGLDSTMLCPPAF